MRCVHITRKKSFFGFLIPYFILLGAPKKETDPLAPEDLWDFPEQPGIGVKNGETVVIPVEGGQWALMVLAHTSTGMAGSPVYPVSEGTEDIFLELITEYSWRYGSRYIIRPVPGQFPNS